MAARPGQSPQKRTRDSTAEQEPQSASKRRKTSPSDYPPRFWDTLSIVGLTRRALKEFDRRTIQPRVEGGETETETRTTRRLLRSDARRLKECAKTGGPDLTTLRGYADAEPVGFTMSQPRSQSRKRRHGSNMSGSSVSGKTKTTTPYSAEFEQKMMDQGVYSTSYRQLDGSRAPQPNNIEEIRDMLGRSRSSLSPSAFPQSAFEEFQDKNDMASSESKVMASVIPIIAGSQDAQHHSAWDVPFNRLQKFDPDVSIAKPDVYYGAQPDQIDRRVRQDLGQYIVPAASHSRPAAPNCFIEGKWAGRPDVALRQVMYDGAIGTRAMFHLQNYGNTTPTYDGNAYTISSSYSDGQLKIYATHPRQSATRNRETDYHLTQVDSFAMTGNVKAFRSGASALRNGRDWAKKQRDQLIISANAVAERSSVEFRSSSIAESTRTSSATREQSSSETSEDELAPQCNANAKRRRNLRSVR